MPSELTKQLLEIIKSSSDDTIYIILAEDHSSRAEQKVVCDFLDDLSAEDKEVLDAIGDRKIVFALEGCYNSTVRINKEKIELPKDIGKLSALEEDAFWKFALRLGAGAEHKIQKDHAVIKKALKLNHNVSQTSFMALFNKIEEKESNKNSIHLLEKDKSDFSVSHKEEIDSIIEFFVNAIRTSAIFEEETPDIYGEAAINEKIKLLESIRDGVPLTENDINTLEAYLINNKFTNNQEIQNLNIGTLITYIKRMSLYQDSINSLTNMGSAIQSTLNKLISEINKAVQVRIIGEDEYETIRQNVIKSESGEHGICSYLKKLSIAAHKNQSTVIALENDSTMAAETSTIYHQYDPEGFKTLTPFGFSITDHHPNSNPQERVAIFDEYCADILNNATSNGKEKKLVFVSCGGDHSTGIKKKLIDKGISESAIKTVFLMDSKEVRASLEINVFALEQGSNPRDQIGLFDFCLHVPLGDQSIIHEKYLIFSDNPIPSPRNYVSSETILNAGCYIISKIIIEPLEEEINQYREKLHKNSIATPPTPHEKKISFIFCQMQGLMVACPTTIYAEEICNTLGSREIMKISSKSFTLIAITDPDILEKAALQYKDGKTLQLKEYQKADNGMTSQKSPFKERELPPSLFSTLCQLQVGSPLFESSKERHS